MINNYTDLSAAITKWCNRSLNDVDFQAQVQNFISLAEQQIFIDCSTLFNQVYDNRIFALDTPQIPKPANWGRTLSLYIYDDLKGTGTEHPNNFPIERITFERGLNFTKNQTVRGMPKYYTDYQADFIHVFPWPDKKYPFLLSCYIKPSPLTLNNSSNTNSINNFDTLFYCALSKAYAYLHNKEESSFYANLYKERVDAFLLYDKNRIVDRNVNATSFNDVF